MSDNRPADITAVPEDDTNLYYKDAPYTTKRLHQRLIITYSPRYARYQKAIRDGQVERAKKMLESGSTKKNRKELLINNYLQNIPSCAILSSNISNCIGGKNGYTC